MAAWRFGYIVDAFDVHDLFQGVVLHWMRVDGCEGGGGRWFAVMKDSGDYLETVVRIAMSVVGDLCPGLTFGLRDLYCNGDAYASFLITADREVV